MISTPQQALARSLCRAFSNGTFHLDVRDSTDANLQRHDVVPLRLYGDLDRHVRHDRQTKK